MISHPVEFLLCVHKPSPNLIHYHVVSKLRFFVIVKGVSSRHKVTCSGIECQRFWNIICPQSGEFRLALKQHKAGQENDAGHVEHRVVNLVEIEDSAQTNFILKAVI